MRDHSQGQTRIFYWLTVSVATIALVGAGAAGVGGTLAKLGFLAVGHPSLAGLLYVLGLAWMHFVCPVGVVVGIVSIILSLRYGSGAYWKMLSIWTVVNLAQASAVAGWP